MGIDSQGVVKSSTLSTFLSSGSVWFLVGYDIPYAGGADVALSAPIDLGSRPSNAGEVMVCLSLENERLCKLEGLEK